MARLYENAYQIIDEEAHYQDIFIDDQDDLKVVIYGFEHNKTKTFFYHLFCILFLGLPYIIFKSSLYFKTLTFTKTPLKCATIILATDSFGKRTLINVKTAMARVPNLGLINLRFFEFQHTKYVWIRETEAFAPLEELIPPLTIDDYLNNTAGLFDVDYMDLQNLYGLNKIYVEVKSYWKLFIEEVFNPFYMFQVFSVALWFFDEYAIYACCVIILTLFSSITSLLQTRKQSEALHDLVETSNCHEVKVLREKLLSEALPLDIDPVKLVPGDLIILPPNNFVMPCDAVLLNGQCIVNESVLTGESVPVTKTAPASSSEVYDTELHKRNTLFSGTTVIQTRYYGGEDVLARVVRTGFNTTKGALVKSILFPSNVGLKFYKDSLKFVFILFLIAGCGMGYCLYIYSIRGACIRYIIIRALDIITIVVPPALPAAMAIGTIYSQSRLKKLGIYCISPPRINVCGKIKLACFDKTGTLTHDCLNMNSVISCENAKFSDPIIEISQLDVKSKFVQGMASCHSLTTIDGNLTGDPLDINMFEFTMWEFEEPGEDDNAKYDMLAPTVVTPGKEYIKQLQNQTEFSYEIGIIKQYPFSSTLQCMSVICRQLDSPHMMAFTKGAPERIQNMCVKESIPVDYSFRLSSFTAKGYRVIALAYKNLPVKFKWKEAQKAKRGLIECDLTFLGFLIMQNPLKSETAPVIRTLQFANIRTVMITGDNILTAVSVARDCGMVKLYDKIFVIKTENTENLDLDVRPRLWVEKPGSVNNIDNTTDFFTTDEYHYAIDGKTWNILKEHYSDFIPNLLVRTTIFARFQPDQKTQVIHALQKLDYVVSMVGDGANDCGALKAAHVGVSLSQAEASVAAPFTSSISDISCIIHLMLEGRCALVTSFATFKYMALYSLIQFTTILILYKHHSILGDYQFLYIDLIITTVLAVTMGHQGPSKKLCVKRPIGSLVSGKNVVPVILQVLTCGLVQLGALYFLSIQSWFEPLISHSSDEVVLSWENTVLFSVSCYQYIIIAAVYSKGKPYRERLLSNLWFLICALSLLLFTTWVLIYPCKFVAKYMDIIYSKKDSPEKFLFRCYLLAFPIVHWISAVFIEFAIGERAWLKRIMQCITRKNIPKNKFKLITNDSDELLNWLRFSNNDYNYS